jgi:hypothetical protein
MIRIVAAVVCSFSSVSAFATEIDFSIPLKNLDGDIAQDCAHATPENKCDKFVPLTLGRLVAVALSKPRAGAVAEQVKDGLLAQRVFCCKADLSAEEIANIKTRLGEINFNTYIIAQAVMILDPPAKK